MRSAWRRIDAAIRAVERASLAFGVMGIAALAIANVVARNLLGGGLPAVEELVQALVLLVTFMGVGAAAREARHIRMAALHDQLRGGPRKLSWALTAAGTSALLAVFAVLAVDYVMHVAAMGSVTPALRIPLAWTYVVAPVGLSLGALEFGLTAWANWRRPGLWLSTTLEEGEAETPAGSM